MLTLLMDTTFQTLQLALADENGIIERLCEPCSEYRYHSAILIPRIEAMVKSQDLSVVAVNLGPGSFTGIRTGLTVARILGQFLGITCYGFNTFEVLSVAFAPEPVTILLNAFRGQHYRAALQTSATGEVTWLLQPEVLPNSSLTPLTTPHCLMEASLQDKIQIPNTQVIDENQLFTPEAMNLFLSHRTPIPWADLKPLYLQLPNITVSKST